ncbi:hypothetical protein JKF63_04587 [Porcisia hertigi]|uniref:Uncharacterized protein n=1 Tax=Porcisia hertigi TaxID=2761500 RepID=A0A836L8U1_9TRYP|nr:hypothetical protein JKF63_04587 [Porcisia hertigi]
MYGGSHRLREVPVAASSAEAGCSFYPAQQRPSNSVWTSRGGVALPSAIDPQTAPPPRGIPWDSFHRTGEYNMSEAENDQPWGSAFSSMTTAAPSTTASRDHQRLTPQNLHGAAPRTSTVGPAASTFSASTASGCGAAVHTTPFLMLRNTDQRGQPALTGHGASSPIGDAKRSSSTGVPAPVSYAVNSSELNGGPMECEREANESTTQSVSAVITGAATPSYSVRRSDHESRNVTWQGTSAHQGTRFTPIHSRSSSAAAAAPFVSPIVAGAVDDRPRSHDVSLRLEQQQELPRLRFRSLPHHSSTSMASAARKHQRPRLRPAWWAVRLIEDLVAQVAVQQKSMVSEPIVVSSSGVANALGRRAGTGGRGAPSATTVADLTASFLSSRYGALWWRPMLHELAACLHRYQRVSPTCAVFREYFIHVDAENLEDFYLFCRLYAAGDIHHFSTVKTKCGVSLATGAALNTANAQTTVTRRYVDEREVCDRLQHMLQRVELIHRLPYPILGQDGMYVRPALSSDVSMPRQLSGCAQYRCARATRVLHQRHLTADEIREIKRAVLGWVAEATRLYNHESSDGGSMRCRGDRENDVHSEAAGVQLQRVSFDREGWVDAYALVQATLEAVKLVCRSDHTTPERCDEDAGRLNGGDNDDGIARIEDAPEPSANQRQQMWTSMGSSARTPQVQRILVSPSSQAYAYPLAKVTPCCSQPQHHSCIPSPLWPASEDGGSHGAPHATEGRQELSHRRTRTSGSVDVSAPSTSMEERLWSPPRGGDGSQNRSPDTNSTSRRPGVLRFHPSMMQRPFSLSPQRQVAAAEEHPQGVSSDSMQQWEQGKMDGRAGKTLHRLSPNKSSFAAYEKLYHHHPYVAELHGNRLWAEALEEAAAASQERSNCLDDRSSRVQRTTPCNLDRGARAAQADFAFPSSPLDATVDSTDAEPQRRQTRGVKNEVESRREMTHSPHILSSPAVAAGPANGLSLPLRLSRVAPRPSKVAYSPRVIPAAARLPGTAAPVARSTHAECSTPLSSFLAILSPSPTSPLSPASEPVASTRHHASHRTMESVASDTVLLTHEEQKMLEQLEIALHQLEFQHRRWRNTTTAAADAAASTKTYA